MLNSQKCSKCRNLRMLTLVLLSVGIKIYRIIREYLRGPNKLIVKFGKCLRMRFMIFWIRINRDFLQGMNFQQL